MGRRRTAFDLLKPRAKRKRSAAARAKIAAGEAVTEEERYEAEQHSPRKPGRHRLPDAELSDAGRRSRIYRAKSAVPHYDATVIQPLLAAAEAVL